MTSGRVLISLIVSFCLVAVILTCCKKDHQIVTPASGASRSPPEAHTERSLLVWSEEEEWEIIDGIKKKLEPSPLVVGDDNVLEPHQFLHLHHMKTGGTSIDHLLKCARDRLTDDFNYTFNHYTIHECWRGKFRKCVQNSTDPCRASMNEAGTMSFCSSLKMVNRFGLENYQAKAFTVLRHPVERVWSMFRYQTRMCYRCKNLTEIYNLIDQNTTRGYDRLCLSQLSNHETENLLSSEWPEDASDDEIVAEAVENLKNFFTLVGLTEELVVSVNMLGTVFPWINKTIEGSNTLCGLPHENKAPENNHCVTTPKNDGTNQVVASHWDLPDHPDEETRKAIEAHNQLDLRLYEAAVQYFELQKRAFDAYQAEQ